MERVNTATGEGEHADMTITYKTLSPNLPIRNLVVSGKSLSFDWKDLDGASSSSAHPKNSGRLSWHDLRADAKMPVILLNKQTARTS
ncbi:MAG TPA: hypothetical protein VNX66_05400 [Candidatus Sulfotelmatobacter sp.]|jgi:hypothetical protein|nr:hypothetical protein [Candidatus Sulfotelmatobacter sp.]